MNDSIQDSIINGILDGDERTITKFYEKYLPQVTSYIIKNSGTEVDAQDIFQDAMVFVYQKLEEGSLELNSPLGGYVYGVCRNMWRNKLRKNKRMLVDDTVLNIVGVDDTDIIEEIISNEKMAIYQRYFLKLGDSCQEVLKLFFSGMSMKEIAKQKDTTDTFIRRKKYKCKKQLIEMVKKDPAFDEIKTSSK